MYCVGVKKKVGYLHIHHHALWFTSTRSHQESPSQDKHKDMYKLTTDARHVDECTRSFFVFVETNQGKMSQVKPSMRYAWEFQCQVSDMCVSCDHLA